MITPVTVPVPQLGQVEQKKKQLRINWVQFSVELLPAEADELAEDVCSIVPLCMAIKSPRLPNPLDFTSIEKIT